MDERSLRRKLQELSRQAAREETNVLTGTSQGQVVNGRVTVIVDGKRISAIAQGNVPYGPCQLYKVGGEWHVKSSIDNRVESTTTVIDRKNRETPTQEDAIALLFRQVASSNFKVLFSVVNGTKQEFWVGGDTPNPRKIYEIDYLGYFVRGYLNNTGVGETDFIFSVKTPTLFYSNIEGTIASSAFSPTDFRRFARYCGNGLWAGTYPSMPKVVFPSGGGEEDPYGGGGGEDPYGGGGYGEDYREEVTYPVQNDAVDTLNGFTGTCTFVEERQGNISINSITLTGSGTNTAYFYFTDWELHQGTATYDYFAFLQGDVDIEVPNISYLEWNFNNAIAFNKFGIDFNVSFSSTGNYHTSPDPVAIEEKVLSATCPDFLSFSDGNILHVKEETSAILENLPPSSSPGSGIDAEGYYYEIGEPSLSSYNYNYKARGKNNRTIYFNQTALNDDFVFVHYLTTTNTTPNITGENPTFNFTFIFNRFTIYDELTSSFYKNSFGLGEHALFAIASLLDKQYRIVVKNPDWESGDARSDRYVLYFAQANAIVSILVNNAEPDNPIYTVTLQLSAAKISTIGFDTKIKSPTALSGNTYGVIYSIEQSIGQILFSSASVLRQYDYFGYLSSSPVTGDITIAENYYLAIDLGPPTSSSIILDRWLGNRYIRPGYTVKAFPLTNNSELRVNNLNMRGDLFFYSEVDPSVKETTIELFAEAWQIENDKLIHKGLRSQTCYALGTTNPNFEIHAVSYYESPVEYRLGGVRSPVELIRGLIDFAILSANGRNFIATYKTGKSGSTFEKIIVQTGSGTNFNTLEFSSSAPIENIKDWRKSLTHSYLVAPPNDENSCITLYRDNPFASVKGDRLLLVNKYELLGQTVLRSFVLAASAGVNATQLQFTESVGSGISSDFALQIHLGSGEKLVVGIKHPPFATGTIIQIEKLPVALGAGLTCDIMTETLARKVKTQKVNATVKLFSLQAGESCNVVARGTKTIAIAPLKLEPDEIEAWEIAAGVAFGEF